jgi:hypothetical protein
LFPVIFIPLLFTFTWPTWSKWFILESSFLTLVYSSVCKSPLRIFCTASLVVMNSFSFSLLWKILISPSIRKGSFAGYTSLG